MAQWIASHAVPIKEVMILGMGLIGKRVRNILKNRHKCWRKAFEVNSKTHENWILDKLPLCDTIIVTSSPTDEPILNEKILSNFHGRVISISRPKCIDNVALLKAIENGNVKRADMDMLDPYGREELISTGKCHYYKHQSWNHNFTYDTSYFLQLSIQINSCLNSTDIQKGLVLDRTASTLDKFFEWGG